MIGVGLVIGLVASSGVFAAAELNGRRKLANVALAFAGAFFAALAAFTAFGYTTGWLVS